MGEHSLVGTASKESKANEKQVVAMNSGGEPASGPHPRY